MIQNYPFFANLLELRKEQFERNTAHMNLSKEEKDRRWRVFEQQQAAEMAMAMQAMNGQSNFSAFESTWRTDNTVSGASYLFNNGSTAVQVLRASAAMTANVSAATGSTQLVYASPPNTSLGPEPLFVGAHIYGGGLNGATKIANISGNTITLSLPTTRLTNNAQLRVNLTTLPNQIRLPLVSNGSYNFYVDWGDGQVDLIRSWNQPEVLHTYSTAGTYNVKILGNITGWDFNFSSDANKIIKINKWGCLRFVEPASNITSGFFCGCNALDLTEVSDIPYLRNIRSIKNMFASFWQERSQGTSPPRINRLNEWDVSFIQDFSGVFQQNQYFNTDIGNWDVSNATNMTAMFAGYNSVGGSAQKGIFDNGGSDSIGNWNVGKVTDMSNMFLWQGSFNRAIGNWDVSNVISFYRFMRGAEIGANNGEGIFNRPLNWNPRSAVTMEEMLCYQRSFNQDIGGWDVSKVQNFNSFLAIPNLTNTTNGVFNNGGADTLKYWNTSSATNMNKMFQKQPQFDQNIGTWNVSNVTNMREMFYIINGVSSTVVTGNFNNGGSDSIKNWDVSKVTTFNTTFYNQPNFNQPIGQWRPSACRIFDYMFANQAIGQGFNQNINGWGAHTAAAQSMVGMFYRNSSYDQPMDQWNTANVTTMQLLFNDATAFNQNIGAWNVVNVIRMDSMFERTTAGAGGFNNGGSSDINNWNMVNVKRVTKMFKNQTSFNQPLGNWVIATLGAGFTYTAPSGSYGTSGTVTLASNRDQAFQEFMAGKTFNDYSTANYDATLIGWASRVPQTAIKANFGTIRYTAAATTARDTVLRTQRGWSFSDGGVI
jgi:surface protein